MKDRQLPFSKRLPRRLEVLMPHLFLLFLVAVITAGFLGLKAPKTAEATVPKLIYYQGKISKTSDGTNIADGNYSMQFKIYSAASSGSLLWTETWDGGTSQVAFKNGLFSVALGTYTSLDTIDFSTGALYLTANFNPGAGYDGEMSPRQQLTSSAFAISANNVIGDGRIDIAYAPSTTTNPAAKVAYSPSVSSSNNALQVTAGSNVTGAAFNVVQSGTGGAILIGSTALGGSTQTYVGANPGSFSGNFIDFQIGSTSKFSVTSAGAVTAASTINGLTLSSTAVSATGALSLTAGGTATNITLTTGTTGVVTHASSTSGSDTIQIKPQSTTTTNAFNGIITSADITTSDKTWTFPNVSGNVITSGDTGTVTNTMLAGSIAASKLIGSDIATVGTLTAGSTGSGFTIALGSSTVTGQLASANGGTGQNWSGTSGLPSLNSGAWTANAITQNGVAYGGASNAMSFTTQGAANTVLVANAGAPSFSAAITVGTSVSSPSISGTTSVTTPSLTNAGTLALSTSASNGNITLTPNGTGIVTHTSGATTGDANTFTAASFAPAAAASASALNLTYSNLTSNSSGTSNVNGLLLTPTLNVASGAGTHQLNGINLGAVGTNTCTPATCNKYAIYAATSNNWTDLFNYNGTSIISGTGLINAAQLTGAVPLSNGGTGQTSFTNGDIPYYNSALSTTALSKLAVGGNGTCLTSNGTIPSWGSCGGSSAITIGSTTISGGTTGNILYHNGTVVGEMTTTGSGTVVALATSPVFTTPTIGVASGTSLALSDNITTGADLGLTNTGVYTGTGLFNLTANSANTGVLANISGTSLTSGTGLKITGGGTNQTSVGKLIDLNLGAATFGTALNISGTGDNQTIGSGYLLTGAANTMTTGDGVNLSFTGMTQGRGFVINGGGANIVTGGKLEELVMGAATAGTGLSINSTGAYTGTATTDGLLRVTANSLSSGLGSQFSFTGLTSGTGLKMTGGGANMTSGGKLVDLIMGAATAGAGLNISTTGAYTGTGLLQASSTGITSGSMLYLNQTTSTYTGTGILLDFANATGTFSGNFVDFRNNTSSKFSVSSAGNLTVAGTTTLSSLGGGGVQCVQTSNTGLLSTTACGGSVSLQTAYGTGNTITTTSASDVAITLASGLATPTAFTITNNHVSATKALYVSGNNASGTVTNGLFFEQTGAGTTTNGLNITRTAGALTNGISFSGTIGTNINLGTMASGSTGILGTLANTTAANATGVNLTTGTIATSGTQTAYQAILTATGAGTVNGLSVFPSGGFSGAAVNAVNIGSISAGGGAEDALNIGSGWDVGLNISGNPALGSTLSVIQLGSSISGGSANGTFIGANGASFSGDFIDMQVNSAKKFVVDSTGAVTAATSVTTPLLTSTSGLTISSAAASNVTVNPGTTGGLIVQSGSGSQTAFSVKDSSGNTVMNVNSASGAGGANLIYNSSFEQNIHNWVKKGVPSTGPIWDNTVGNAKFGNGTLKFIGTAVGDGAQYSFPFAASTQYSATFWAKTASGTATLRLDRQDNGSDVGGCSDSSVTTTWTQFTCTFTTGGTINTSTSNIFIKQNAVGTPTVFIDGFTLTLGGTTMNFVSPGNNIQVDEDYSNITLNAGQDADIQPWQLNSTALPSGRRGASMITANGFMYFIGGTTANGTSGAPVTTVNYTRINADGSLSAGSWLTTTVLPVALYGHSSISANGYLYIIGGCSDSSATAACTTPVSTVYYSKLNSDGTLGTWQTATTSNSLPAARGYGAAVFSNGYLYYLGGYNASAQTTVYSARLNADGAVNGWTSTGVTALGTARYGETTMNVNGKIYSIGGCSDAGALCNTALTTVEYATPANDGTLGAWTAATSLPVATGFHTTGILNGYLFNMGGRQASTTVATVYYAKVNSVGPLGAWQTSTNPLPAVRQQATTLWVNTYLYQLGGFDGTTTLPTTAYFASGARVSIFGGLDLLDLSSQTLTDYSGGGTLTAGNTRVVGDLRIDGFADLNNGLSVDSVINLNAVSAVTGQTVFNINNLNSNSIFSVRHMNTTIGSLVSAGVVIENMSNAREEFSASKAANTTAGSTAGYGDSGKWYTNNSVVTNVSTGLTTSNPNGFIRIAPTANSGVGGEVAFGATAGTLDKIFTPNNNLPIIQMKVRPSVMAATDDFVWGMFDQATAPTTNDTLPANGIFFWPNNGTGATGWVGVVRSASANLGTVTCPGSATANKWATGRIEVLSNSGSNTVVHFMIDNDASDGVNMIDCGTVTTASIWPSATTLGYGMYDVHTVAAATTFDMDYAAWWQDDSNGPVGGVAATDAVATDNSNSAEQTPLAIDPAATQAESFDAKKILQQFMDQLDNPDPTVAITDTDIDRLLVKTEIVAPKLTINGLTVDSIGALGQYISILSDTNFIGRPYFNSDTAGFAKFKAGDQKVSIQFDDEYLTQPVVSVGVSQEADITKTTDPDVIQKIEKDQEDAAASLFEAGIQFLVINKTDKGFTIILNKPAPQDMTFSWIALAVKDAKISLATGTVAGDSTGQPSSAGQSSSDSSNVNSSDQSSQNSNTSPAADNSVTNSTDNTAPDNSVSSSTDAAASSSSGSASAPISE